MKFKVTKKKLGEFYKWAMNYFANDEETMATHPLNWISISAPGIIFKEEDLPGLYHIKEALKDALVGKKYKYTVIPNSMMKITKSIIPEYEGKLIFIKELNREGFEITMAERIR